MRQLSLIFILFLFVSCSQDNWTKDEQKAFTQICREEGGSKDYCDCFMQNVMQDYPIAEDADEIDFETKIELSKDCK